LTGTHNEISGTVSGAVVQADHIDKVDIHLPTPAPTALAGLPADDGLTGRATELAVLADVLSPDHEPDTPTTCTIAGLAGAGKTALAVRAARTAHAQFPGGMLFVDLAGYDPTRCRSAQSALSTFVRILGVPGEHLPQDQADLEVLYRSLLSDLTQPVLVLADNASTIDQVLPLRPGDPRHRMLVTSRHTLPIPGARRIELDALPDDDAIALLDHALRAANPDDRRITAEPVAAAALARLCGRLPLALQLIAHVLADDPDRPITDLVDTLATEQDRLSELTYGETDEMRTAFDTSYRHLPAEQARVFRLMAVNPCPQIDLDTVAAIADLPPATTRHLVNGLRRAHLVQPVSGGYTMHDLVYLYAGERLDADEPDPTAAVHRLLNHYLAHVDAAVSQLDPRIPTDTSIFTDRAQALAWLDAQHANLVATIALAAEFGEDTMITQIAGGLTAYFDQRREPADWATTSEYAIAAARRLGDKDTEAFSHNTLGLAYRGLQGRLPDAITCFHRAKELYEEIGNDDGLAGVLTNLGNTHEDLDQLPDAIDSHQQAATLYEEVGNQHGHAIALANLAYAERTLGQLAEALEHYEEAALDFHLAGDPYNTARLQDNIAHLHLTMGNDTDAQESHEQALDLFRQMNDPRAEANSHAGMADAYAELERFDEALDAYQLAVDAWRDLGDRFEEGQVMSRTAITHWRAGHLADALETNLQLLALHQETGNTYGVGTTLSYLGLIHRDLGEWDQAQDYYQRSIAIFEADNAPKEVDNVKSLAADLERRRPQP